MFKNCVFKVSVSTKEWWKAAGMRAIKTVAQTAVSMIVVGSTATEVDWLNILSVSAVICKAHQCVKLVLVQWQLQVIDIALILCKV